MIPRRTTCGLVLLAASLVACEAVMPVLRVLATGIAQSNYGSEFQQYGKQLEHLIDTFDSARHALQPEAAEASTPQPPLELDIALLRQEDVDGAVIPVAMEDGETLVFRGTAQDSDRFKLYVRPSDRCFVYVINVDATGWVTPLYPAVEDFGRPMRAGSARFLPEGNDMDLAYAVDRHRGIETLYFVASRERRTDIEDLMAKFGSLRRPELDAPDAIEDISEGNGYVMRGVRKPDVRHRGTVRTRSGDEEFDTATFIQESGADVVVTRWFRHE